MVSWVDGDERRLARLTLVPLVVLAAARWKLDCRAESLARGLDALLHRRMHRRIGERGRLTQVLEFCGAAGQQRPFATHRRRQLVRGGGAPLGGSERTQQQGGRGCAVAAKLSPEDWRFHGASIAGQFAGVSKLLRHPWYMPTKSWRRGRR